MDLTASDGIVAAELMEDKILHAHIKNKIVYVDLCDGHGRDNFTTALIRPHFWGLYIEFSAIWGLLVHKL